MESGTKCDFVPMSNVNNPSMGIANASLKKSLASTSLEPQGLTSLKKNKESHAAYLNFMLESSMPMALPRHLNFQGFLSVACFERPF